MAARRVRSLASWPASISRRNFAFLDQRPTVRQRLRQLCEFRQACVQGSEIAEQVADQAVGEIASQIWEAGNEFPKVKLLVIKGVDQFAHGLDTLAELLSVFGEAGG